MSLIDEINRASSRVNRANQSANRNVQKVTAVTGGFENAVGNYNQSISNVKRTVTNTVRQFTKIQSGIGKIIGAATGNQPGQTGTTGQGGGGTSNAAGSITVKGQATSGIAGTMSAGLIGVGVVGQRVKDFLGGLFAINNEFNTTFEDTIQNQRRGLDFAINFQNPYDIIAKSKANQQVGSISFPPDITQQVDSWMNLFFYEYSRFRSSSEGTLSPIESITVPVPNDYSQVHGIRIESQDLGVLGLGEDTLSAAMTGMSAPGTLRQDLQATWDAATIDAAGKGKYFFFNRLNELTPNLGGMVGQQLGAVPNPHPTVFFKGVELRDFAWTWRFVPRSKEESAQLKSLLNTIKRNALPKQNSFMLGYPSIVKPGFGGKAKDHLGKFKACMITGFSVNYAPEGTSAFFHDGAPVSIVLQLGLKEVEQFLSNDVEE